MKNARENFPRAVSLLFFSKEINPRFYRGNKNALVKKNRASKGKPEKGVEEKKTSK